MIPLYKTFIPPEAIEGVAQVLRSGAVAEGNAVRAFEVALQGYLGNRHVVALHNASFGVMLGLYAAGVRPGDEVLASPMACLATNMPILHLFAKPVWCDIDPFTGNIDLDELPRRISPRTKAILYAHWGGYVADVHHINGFAREHGLKVVEDASEALGATIEGHKIGQTGSDYVVFSFSAVKHLTTGEGGALAASTRDAVELLRRLKRYGICESTFRDEISEINPSSDVDMPGYNLVMSDYEAALGTAQFAHLDRNLAARRLNGRFFAEVLNGHPELVPLGVLPRSQPAYWIYSLLANDARAWIERLRQRGIGASRVHLRNDVYSCFGKPEYELPGVTEFMRRQFSIPCGWWLSVSDRGAISDALNGWRS